MDLLANLSYSLWPLNNRVYLNRSLSQFVSSQKLIQKNDCIFQKLREVLRDICKREKFVQFSIIHVIFQHSDLLLSRIVKLEFSRTTETNLNAFVRPQTFHQIA